jgi:broad specificity polyphosphatase/5'/3'-nucleotidase SurE
MPSFLLLDSTTVTLTSLLGVYIALGGTLAAAGLAAFASFRASNKASATAQEVADLTTRTAQELKDKDYRNDFYKKVIERRFRAWEEAESIMSIIAPSNRDLQDGKSYFIYFASLESLNNLINKVRSSITTQVLWMGNDYALKYKELHNNLSSFKTECRIESEKEGHASIHDNTVKLIGKRRFEDCRELYKSLFQALSNELKLMHDVETFFSRLDSVRIYELSTQAKPDNGNQSATTLVDTE